MCPGHPDEHFIPMVKAKGGILLSQTESVSGMLDNSGLHCLNGQRYSETVRSSKCHILVQGIKCFECVKYRSTLRALYSKWTKQQSQLDQPINSPTNDRWLKPSEMRERLQEVRSKLKTAEKKIDYLKLKIKESHERLSIAVDDELHEGLGQIIMEHAPEIKSKYSPNSFHHLFWEQQVENMQKIPSQRRWHPMLIRWCLHLHMLSAAAYDAVRHVLVLPSDRTLRDYTHFIKSGIGIQNEVTMQLMKEANIDASEEWQKFVALSFDEIKIKEGIVYDKHECRIIGFVDLGPTNNHLAAFDNATTAQSSTIPVANHMLTIMVRGILTNLCFPYTHYSTNGVTAVELQCILNNMGKH